MHCIIARVYMHTFCFKLVLAVSRRAQDIIVIVQILCVHVHMYTSVSSVSVL